MTLDIDMLAAALRTADAVRLRELADDLSAHLERELLRQEEDVFPAIEPCALCVLRRGHEQIRALKWAIGEALRTVPPRRERAAELLEELRALLREHEIKEEWARHVER